MNAAAEKWTQSVIQSAGSKTAADRALLFYRMQQTWCWDCGIEQKKHPSGPCTSPLFQEPQP